ncbi:hypothetical protein ARTHRO9V_90134 [Arthrobacter sp. 9V]|nr:hypothetical protein ARTHRO9V_90134 [Arthrobacter sp. 9V]
MELFDAHTVVMSAVLLVHILGVVILAISAVASFAVVLAVRGVRSTWAMTRNAGSRRPVISPLSKRARSY